MRSMRRFGFAAVAAALIATGVVACGDDDDDGGAGGGTVIRGTTDQPVGFDPANIYDLPSWDVLVNVYQTLLTIPPGGNQPEPDAAESCDFRNPTTYECTIKDGLTFSDGSPLTAEDVKFSFDRNIEIESPTGAASVLANVSSIEAPDDATVVFELKEPDAVFPYILTMQSFAIVPSDVFPPDDIQPDEQVI